MYRQKTKKRGHKVLFGCRGREAGTVVDCRPPCAIKLRPNTPTTTTTSTTTMGSSFSLQSDYAILCEFFGQHKAARRVAERGRVIAAMCDFLLTNPRILHADAVIRRNTITLARKYLTTPVSDRCKATYRCFLRRFDPGFTEGAAVMDDPCGHV